MSRSSYKPAVEKSSDLEVILADVKQLLETIQFGTIEISIHDGRVVQLEKREKKRY